MIMQFFNEISIQQSCLVLLYVSLIKITILLQKLTEGGSWNRIAYLYLTVFDWSKLIIIVCLCAISVSLAHSHLSLHYPPFLPQWNLLRMATSCAYRHKISAILMPFLYFQRLPSSTCSCSWLSSMKSCWLCKLSHDGAKIEDSCKSENWLAILLKLENWINKIRGYS